MVGPSLREFTDEFQTDLTLGPEDPNGQPAYTADLDEYFGKVGKSPFQVAMASPILDPRGPFEFKSGTTHLEPSEMRNDQEEKADEYLLQQQMLLD